jgi:hypothetical protein
MTYGRPTWECVADAQLLKLRRLQKRVLRTTGNFGMCTSGRELHVAFKVPYVYVYITELCRTQAEVILNNVNPNVRGIAQGEAMHRQTWRRSGPRPLS